MWLKATEWQDGMAGINTEKETEGERERERDREREKERERKREKREIAEAEPWPRDPTQTLGCSSPIMRCVCVFHGAEDLFRRAGDEGGIVALDADSGLRLV